MEAVGGVEHLRALSTLDGDVDVVAVLYGTLLINLVVLDVVLLEGLEFLLDLLVGHLFRRYGDGYGLVVRELDLGADLDTHGVCEVLALLDQIHVVHGGIGQRIHISLGEDDVLLVVQDGVGRLSHDRLLAERGVEHRTRSLTGTEAGHAIPVGQVLVRSIDVGIHLRGGHRHIYLQLIVLESLH